MRSLIIIGLVIITSIIACTKVGRNITIKGKVINPLANVTYEGIKVQLVKSQSLSLPGGYKEIKHTFTDENGAFELNATRLGEVWVQAQSGSDLYVVQTSLQTNVFIHKFMIEPFLFPSCKNPHHPKFTSIAKWSDKTSLWILKSNVFKVGSTKI